MYGLFTRGAAFSALFLSSALAAASPLPPQPASPWGPHATPDLVGAGLRDVEIEAEQADRELLRAHPGIAWHRVRGAATRLSTLVRLGAARGDDAAVRDLFGRLASLKAQAEYQEEIIEDLRGYLATYEATPVHALLTGEEIYQLARTVRTLPEARARALLLRGVAAEADHGVNASLLSEIEGAPEAFQVAIGHAVSVHEAWLQETLVEARVADGRACRQLAVARSREIAKTLRQLDPGNALALLADRMADALVASDAADLGGE